MSVVCSLHWWRSCCSEFRLALLLKAPHNVWWHVTASNKAGIASAQDVWCCRAVSLDGRSPEVAAAARRNRRIRTVDYSKPGGDAPFSVPSMSGMAGRSALLLHLCCLRPSHHPFLAWMLQYPQSRLLVSHDQRHTRLRSVMCERTLPVQQPPKQAASRWRCVRLLFGTAIACLEMGLSDLQAPSACCSVLAHELGARSWALWLPVSRR